MELKNIQVTNFRTIEDQSLNPGKISVLIGPNGSGKSSMLEAISFLLTGKVGSRAPREGTAFAEVSADVMGVPLYRRAGVKSTVKMNGKATTQKSVQQWIENSAGITTDTLRVATSSGMLAAMNSREFSEFLITNKLIPAEIDMDTMTMLCSVTPEALAELEHMLPPAPLKFTMEDIDEAYKHYFSLRPALKKQLSEKKLQANYAGATPTRTLSQIETELASLNAYTAELNAYNKLLRSYNDTIAKRNAAQATLAEIEDKLRTNKTDPVDPNELVFLEGQKKKGVEFVLALNKEAQIVRGNLDMFRRTLANLDKPVCPISAKLICTTDKTAIKEELNELVAQNQALLDGICTKIQKAEAKILAYDARIQDFNTRRDAFRELENLRTRHQTIKSNMPEPGEPPKEPQRIPDADHRIAQLNEERRLIYAIEMAKNAEKEIPALEGELSICEELIELLCPKGGIREKIIAAAFEPLIEHCNEQAKRLKPDFEIGLVSDDGVHIVCKPKGVTNMIPLDAASAGEQLVVMLLILDAINSLSNLGLLVLDDLDKLDAVTLNSLFAMLQDPVIIDNYDHIFVAMVNHEDSMAIIDKYESELTVLDMTRI